MTLEIKYTWLHYHIGFVMVYIDFTIVFGACDNGYTMKQLPQVSDDLVHCFSR